MGVVSFLSVQKNAALKIKTREGMMLFVFDSGMDNMYLSNETSNFQAVGSFLNMNNYC